MSGYVAAATEQRSADGAEAEYNAAIGIAGNRFPLELLAPPEQRAARDETRATTDADIQTMPRRWLDRLFAGTAADAAWTVSLTEMKPKRNAVRLHFSIEDAARIPGLESALTRDLRMALVEGVDRAIFLGDATATGTDSRTVP